MDALQDRQIKPRQERVKYLYEVSQVGFNIRNNLYLHNSITSFEQHDCGIETIEDGYSF